MEHVALDETELDTIRCCLVAVQEGPFIEDWEFQTRLGIDRAELGAIISAPLRLDDCSRELIAQDAINNCMNEILNGVVISPAEWDKWFDVSRQRVQTTFQKWLALNP